MYDHTAVATRTLNVHKAIEVPVKMVLFTHGFLSEWHSHLKNRLLTVVKQPIQFPNISGVRFSTETKGNMIRVQNSCR